MLDEEEILNELWFAVQAHALATLQSFVDAEANEVTEFPARPTDRLELAQAVTRYLKACL